MKKNNSVFYFYLTFLFCLITIFSINKKVVASASAFNTPISSCAKAAILLEEKSNTVLYSKNEKERLPIASMCKIMTLLVCFEELDNGTFNLNDDVTVSANAAGMGGSVPSGGVPGTAGF